MIITPFIYHDLARGIRQKRNKASFFDGVGQFSLVSGAGAAFAARDNFPIRRNIALKCWQVFVVNFLNMLSTEITYFIFANFEHRCF